MVNESLWCPHQPLACHSKFRGGRDHCKQGTIYETCVMNKGNHKIDELNGDEKKLNKQQRANIKNTHESKKQVLLYFIYFRTQGQAWLRLHEVPVASHPRDALLASRGHFVRRTCLAPITNPSLTLTPFPACFY